MSGPASRPGKRSAVGTGHSGTVEYEGHRQPVHGDVEQNLVECTVQEGRVDRDNRVHAAHREACRAGNRVLLGDTHVEHPVRIRRRELRQAGWMQHRRCDRDHIRALGTDRDQLVPEDLGPGAGLGGRGLRGLGRSRRGRRHLVQAVLLVLLS